jgi:hypothetical protein
MVGMWSQQGGRESATLASSMPTAKRRLCAKGCAGERARRKLNAQVKEKGVQERELNVNVEEEDTWE